MGRIVVGPPGETVSKIETLDTQEMELVVEKSQLISFQSPVADNRLAILEEINDDLYDQLNELRNEINSLSVTLTEQKTPELKIVPAQQVTQIIEEKYNDEALRALIQQLTDVVEQNYNGQDFVNSRFRQDINSLRNEKQPVSEIVRIHERLPKWVFYGFIFNFLLALIGFLT